MIDIWITTLLLLLKRALEDLKKSKSQAQDEIKSLTVSDVAREVCCCFVPVAKYCCNVVKANFRLPCCNQTHTSNMQISALAMAKKQSERNEEVKKAEIVEAELAAAKNWPRKRPRAHRRSRTCRSW